jgi:flagellar protein FlgJ
MTDIALSSGFIGAQVDIAKESVAIQNLKQNITGSLNGKQSPERIQKAGEEFEAQFLSFMFKTMFNTVEVDENFGGGYAEETFRDFLSDEYANIVAKSGGIGVSQEIQKTLMNLQEF